MDLTRGALVLACIVVVSAIAPIEEFHVPKPYSFGYAIKDKHGEQHRQEVGDGLHSVKGSYGFKDDRGIERQVNYVADKGGFRAEVKTNEPGTAPLNPAAVKMESSAHPYFGIAKGPIAAGIGKDGLEFAGGFGYPGLLKFDAAELSKSIIPFDAGLAKENELEKEALSSKLIKEGLAYGGGIGLEKLGKEGLLFSPFFAGGLAKEAEAAKEGLVFSPFATGGLAKEAEAAKGLATGFGLEELLKQGFALVPLEAAAKEATLEKEGLAFGKSLGADELAKFGLLYSPLFAKENLASGFKEEESKRGLALGKFAESFPFAPKFAQAASPFASPLPFALPKAKGYAYGGPIAGGVVNGYDARFY